MTRSKFLRRVGVEPDGRHGLPVDESVDSFGWAVSAERQKAGNRLVQHNTERVQVGAKG
jgi:hypothetical protein